MAGNPVVVDKVYGDIGYFEFFSVSVLIMGIFFAASMGGGTVLIKERENGIHEGYLVTLVKRSTLVLGMISSGTIRPFVAGFAVSWIELVFARIALQSVWDFFLVCSVILVTRI